LHIPLSQCLQQISLFFGGGFGGFGGSQAGGYARHSSYDAFDSYGRGRSHGGGGGGDWANGFVTGVAKMFI